MTYDPFTKTFKASTRKGATLEFDNGKAFLLHLVETLDFKASGSASGVTTNVSLEEWINKGLVSYDSDPRGSLEYLFKSKYLGFFFNRLQSDNFNQKLVQDFTLRYIEGS